MRLHLSFSDPHLLDLWWMGTGIGLTLTSHYSLHFPGNLFILSDPEEKNNLWADQPPYALTWIRIALQILLIFDNLMNRKDFSNILISFKPLVFLDSMLCSNLQLSKYRFRNKNNCRGSCVGHTLACVFLGDLISTQHYMMFDVWHTNFFFLFFIYSLEYFALLNLSWICHVLFVAHVPFFVLIP